MREMDNANLNRFQQKFIIYQTELLVSSLYANIRISS